MEYQTADLLPPDDSPVAMVRRALLLCAKEELQVLVGSYAVSNTSVFHNSAPRNRCVAPDSITRFRERIVEDFLEQEEQGLDYPNLGDIAVLGHIFRRVQDLLVFDTKWSPEYLLICSDLQAPSLYARAGRICARGQKHAQAKWLILPLPVATLL